MQFFKEKIKSRVSFLFIVLDIFLIIFSVYLAFLLRFDGLLPADKLDNFLAFTVLAVILTIPIFFLQSLYKISWSYISLIDLPVIGWAITVSCSVLGLSVLLLQDLPYFFKFPRSVIFIYAILLFLFITALRFSKRIYWQMIRSRPLVPQTKNILKFQTFKEDLPKTVLITGGAGYVGSVLARRLLNKGYTVKVVDKLLFNDESIRELRNNPNFQFIQEDILNLDKIKKVLVNVDAVIHLAAIVGEAACVSQKDIALKTNYLGTVYLARLCKSYGIKRFIYSSTCSIYGNIKSGGAAREDSNVYPVDFYGETKIYAERELIKLMDNNFFPTILRFSTVYGLSPRMRFDLVVNVFAKKMAQGEEIMIFGGHQWRPLIHIEDLAKAINLCLEQPLSKIGSQIINVGDNKENYLISRLGELVKECSPSTEVKNMEDITDNRSYEVSFDKIEKLLKFKAERTVKDGMLEIKKAIEEGRFRDVEDKIYYNHLV